MKHGRRDLESASRYVKWAIARFVETGHFWKSQDGEWQDRGGHSQKLLFRAFGPSVGALNSRKYPQYGGSVSGNRWLTGDLKMVGDMFPKHYVWWGADREYSRKKNPPKFSSFVLATDAALSPMVWGEDERGVPMKFPFWWDDELTSALGGRLTETSEAVKCYKESGHYGITDNETPHEEAELGGVGDYQAGEAEGVQRPGGEVGPAAL